MVRNVASYDLEIEKMDVKIVFLHGDLDKEIYLQQPEGFEVKAEDDHVFALKKCLDIIRAKVSSPLKVILTKPKVEICEG